jgi:hypothetical protein
VKDSVPFFHGRQLLRMFQINRKAHRDEPQPQSPNIRCRTKIACLLSGAQEGKAQQEVRGYRWPLRKSLPCDEQLRSETGQSLNPTGISRLEGRPVVRSPEQLRLHRALDELDWAGGIGELNEAVRLTDPSVTQPILITTNGTILAGFGRWRLAAFERRHEIHCIEYPLSEDEALQFIISHHQPQREWNAFIRIRLALKLEPYFQKRALDNMRAGGKYKGWANLPEAQQIEVRQEIARAAGVGARNVSNVRTILQSAHPRLIEALRNSTLTINRAIQFCKLPRAEQLEQFIRYSTERATNKVIRQSIARPKQEKTSLDVVAVLDALQQQEVKRSDALPPLTHLRFVHRYLDDGKVEVVCMSCFDVVCNVRFEEDAAPFLDTHACGSAEPPKPADSLWANQHD